MKEIRRDIGTHSLGHDGGRRVVEVAGFEDDLDVVVDEELVSVVAEEAPRVLQQRHEPLRPRRVDRGVQTNPRLVRVLQQKKRLTNVVYCTVMCGDVAGNFMKFRGENGKNRGVFENSSNFRRIFCCIL